MRGRLIARQPAQDHRLNHALAKIVGKTHPRRPHSRSVNEEAEINRFGNPPTDLIRSDTALSENATRVRELSDQIAAAEREIDQIVYALFGLTPDEIALLEASLEGQY